MSEDIEFEPSCLVSTRYKPIGTQTGATENSKDGFETIRVRTSAYHGTRDTIS